VLRIWNRNILLLAGGFGLGILAGLLILAGGVKPKVEPASQEQSGAGLALMGRKAPDFELTAASGESVRLADYAGMPVVVNFWATWCRPCLEEMPLLDRRYEGYRQKMMVLAVNYEEDAQVVQDFAAEADLRFPILIDSGGAVIKQYQVYGLPTTYFLDAQGVVQAVHLGQLSEKTLDEYLEKIGVNGD